MAQINEKELLLAEYEKWKKREEEDYKSARGRRGPNGILSKYSIGSLFNEVMWKINHPEESVAITSKVFNNSIGPTGLIYDKSALEKAIKNFCETNDEYSKLVTLGNRDNPTVSLVDVCGKVSNISLDNDDVDVTVDLLDTPQGKTAQALLAAKHSLQIYPRGFGKVEETEDGQKVVNDFTLTGFDIDVKNSFK